MKQFLIFLLVIVANSSFAKDGSQPLKIKPLDKGVYLHTSFKLVHGYGLAEAASNKSIQPTTKTSAD